MTILHVRTALSCKGKSQSLQNATDLARLENGRFGHELCSYRDALCANELGLQLRFTVFQEHLDDLPEIALKLVERLALRVSTWKPRNEANIQAGIRTTLNYGGECSHGWTVWRCSVRVNGHWDA